jgi:hypothetical protein
MRNVALKNYPLIGIVIDEYERKKKQPPSIDYVFKNPQAE